MIRKMGDFEVTQRTKDGMFNATYLAKQWNSHNKTSKLPADFLRLDSTKEFIKALELENLHTGIPICKKSKASRGPNAGTWMNPLLFIDFAMWLNPSFKVKVLQFVYDELIKNRHLAGDNYKALSSSGKKLKGYNYKEVAKAIQWVVFGKTGKELRQTASETQLKEISNIEEKLCFAIDMGYIKSYEELLHSLRVMYNNKYLKPQ